MMPNYVASNTIQIDITKYLHVWDSFPCLRFNRDKIMSKNCGLIRQVNEKMPWAMIGTTEMMTFMSGYVDKWMCVRMLGNSNYLT